MGLIPNYGIIEKRWVVWPFWLHIVHKGEILMRGTIVATTHTFPFLFFMPPSFEGGHRVFFISHMKLGRSVVVGRLKGKIQDM